MTPGHRLILQTAYCTILYHTVPWKQENNLHLLEQKKSNTFASWDDVEKVHAVVARSYTALHYTQHYTTPNYTYDYNYDYDYSGNCNCNYYSNYNYNYNYNYTTLDYTALQL